jgi:hypothetical protein
VDRKVARFLLHWLSMSSLSEDLRCHVTRCSASCGQDMELLFIHNSRQSEVGNQQISVVFWGSEQQILRLQVSMHDAVVMKVCDSRKCGADKIASIRFVVVALSADAVEQLAAKCEVGNKVHYARSQLEVRPGGGQYLQLFMVSK